MRPSGAGERVPHPSLWERGLIVEQDATLYADRAEADTAGVEGEDEAPAVDPARFDDVSAADEPVELELPTDSLQVFLKDIGKVHLLTAAQEVELAKRIERGDDLAKRQMVEANLRLVVSIAISSDVGSCPRSARSLRSVRRILFSFSTTWTGMRIVRALSASARATACRIHQVAYVENLKPLR